MPLIPRQTVPVIVAAWNRGLSANYIGGMVGCSPKTVRRSLERVGITPTARYVGKAATPDLEIELATASALAEQIELPPEPPPEATLQVKPLTEAEQLHGEAVRQLGKTAARLTREMAGLATATHPAMQASHKRAVAALTDIALGDLADLADVVEAIDDDPTADVARIQEAIAIERAQKIAAFAEAEQLEAIPDD